MCYLRGSMVFVIITNSSKDVAAVLVTVGTPAKFYCVYNTESMYVFNVCDGFMCYNGREQLTGDEWKPAHRTELLLLYIRDTHMQHAPVCSACVTHAYFQGYKWPCVVTL